MSRLLVLLLLFSGPFNLLKAQPFDTLLTQFTSIHDIFPLLDSTFILVGGNDNGILVERINQKAEVIWSLPVVSTYKDYLRDIRYDINTEDSIIQLSTGDKDCDAYGTSLHKVFNVSFSGIKLDSQTVSFGEEQGYIYLLSGLPDRPRLAYIDDKKVIVMQANGDTLHLHMPLPNGDSSLAYLFGIPLIVTMCPGGDILVGTNVEYVFYYRLENNRYVVYDRTRGGENKILYCLDDQYYISASDHYLTLWENLYPLSSFSLGEGVLFNAIWRSPYLVIQTFGYPDPDSMFFLNSHLELQYKEELPDYRVSTMAIDQETTYRVGSGNTYFDHGLLVSEHQITHDGPEFYEVEIIDFQPGPYDDVHWKYGAGIYYIYDIPHATVTLKNHTDHAIDNVVIHFGRTTGFCSDTAWERELTDMQLGTGETRSFDLYDIFLTQDYPDHSYNDICVYVIRPDKHFDDYFDDNELCKKIDLIPSPVVNQDFPIHHTPSVFTDDIRFVSPVKIDFELMIYSYSGIPVFTGHVDTYSGATLDLSFLPAGLYIFQYYIPDQEKRYVEKIMKY